MSFADDVLKARLKTVGVAEYIFELETAAGRDSGTEWRIIDVGGSRSQVRLIIRVHKKTTDGLHVPYRDVNSFTVVTYFSSTKSD